MAFDRMEKLEMGSNGASSNGSRSRRYVTRSLLSLGCPEVGDAQCGEAAFGEITGPGQQPTAVKWRSAAAQEC